MNNYQLEYFDYPALDYPETSNNNDTQSDDYWVQLFCYSSPEDRADADNARTLVSPEIDLILHNNNVNLGMRSIADRVSRSVGFIGRCVDPGSIPLERKQWQFSRASNRHL